jgi:hypothetical protein
MLPFTLSRTSNLLRGLRTLFRINISSRRFYTFLGSPKLPWGALWKTVWGNIPSPLTDGRLLLALDDSINPKVGKEIFACHRFFDHAAKDNQGQYPWAQNIVLLGVVKKIHQRWTCLPLSFRFYRLAKDIKEGFKTKLEQAVNMALSVANYYIDAPILIIADSWFGNDSLLRPLKKELGDRINLLSRLRSNANLFNLPPDKKKKRRGAPKKYGNKRGNAKTLARSKKKRSTAMQVFLYGKNRTAQVADEVLMSKSLKARIHVVWVFYKKSWVALYTTDLSLTVAQIVEYYGARWKIESGFKELKQEIGSKTCQARNEHHVTNHLHMCMMTMTLVWCYCDRLDEPPARRHIVQGRGSFAFSDVRHLIASNFDQKEFKGGLKKTRKPRKINVIQTILQLAA